MTRRPLTLAPPPPSFYLRRLRTFLAVAWRLYDHAIEAAEDDRRRWGYPFDRGSLAYDVRRHVKHGLIREKRRVRDEDEEPVEFEQQWPPNNGLRVTVGQCEMILLRGAGGQLPIPHSDARVRFYCQEAKQLELDLSPLIPKGVNFQQNLVLLYDVEHDERGILRLAGFWLVLPRRGSKRTGTAAAWWTHTLSRPESGVKTITAAQQPPPLDIEPLTRPLAPTADMPPPLPLELLGDDQDERPEDEDTDQEANGQTG